jgi:hypothetical protein
VEGGTVNLSPADATRISAAMAQVRQKHDLAQQAPDTEATRQALFSLSLAVSKAVATLNNVEQETRAAAEDALIRGRVRKLENAQ